MNALTVNNFHGNGIRLTGNGSQGVAQCHIGTNAAGRDAVPSQVDGVYIRGAPGNHIGFPQQGNLISGNSRLGVLLSGAGATGNTVQGNVIGLDLAPVGALPMWKPSPRCSLPRWAVSWAADLQGEKMVAFGAAMR